jgi:hypothetical protein
MGLRALSGVDSIKGGEVVVTQNDYVFEWNPVICLSVKTSRNRSVGDTHFALPLAADANVAVFPSQRGDRQSLPSIKQRDA